MKMYNPKLSKIFPIIFLLSFLAYTYALDSSKFEEKGCLAAAKPDATLKEEFISKTAVWFIPIASTYAYNLWVEKLTNASATPDKLQKLCLEFLFLASSKPNTPYMVAAGGLNKVVTFQCSSSSLQQQTCDSVPGSPNYAPGVESEETIVQTDNKSYILMVQCIQKKLKSWYVMTPTNAEPAPPVKADILKTVSGLGFDKKLASGISYAGCPKPKN